MARNDGWPGARDRVAAAPRGEEYRNIRAAPLSADTATDGNVLRFGSRSAVSRSMLKVEHASPRRFRLVHMQPARPRLVSLCARAGYGQATRRGARTQRSAARASTALRPYPSKASRSGRHAAAPGHHGASRKPAFAESQGYGETADPNRSGERHGFAGCRKAHTGAALGEFGHAAAPWHQVGGADLGKRTGAIGDVGTGALMQPHEIGLQVAARTALDGHRERAAHSGQGSPLFGAGGVRHFVLIHGCLECSACILDLFVERVFAHPENG